MSEILTTALMYIFGSPGERDYFVFHEHLGFVCFISACSTERLRTGVAEKHLGMKLGKKTYITIL